MFKNQKGSSVIALIVLLFVFIAGLVGFIWFYKMNALKSTDNASTMKTEVGTINLDNSQKETTYTPMEESSATPKEVDNATVDELDALMKDIDNDSDEDVSDLSL